MYRYRISSSLISRLISARYSKLFYTKSRHSHSDNDTPKWSQPKELKISLSYGHVAAQTWGDETGEPVLALHGWKDNSGSFDKLVPLLNPNLYIVAIDAPGQGLSSHKPPGAFYHLIETVIDLRRVIDYLKWDKFSFLGHSLGAKVNLLYTSMFPEEVKSMVSLDTIRPICAPTEQIPDLTRGLIESCLHVEKKMAGKVPVYTMEEARDRFMKAAVHEISEESADALLKRGCVPSSDGKGVVFSRDIRLHLRETIQIFSHDDMKAYMRRIKCNMLILLSNNGRDKYAGAGIFFEKKNNKEAHDFLDIYKENCQSLKVIPVDGSHFVHLDNPEKIAPHINAFFSEHLGLNSPRL